jgi:hypothetical protein
MPVPSPQPQDSQAITVIVLFVAALCVVYWRTALRVIAIILIAFAVLGMITGFHGLHHVSG